MEVIKKINNNAAICIDSAGNELVAIGTGIGYPSIPYILEDLNIIQRTYYGVNPVYFDLLNQIPEEIFNVSAKIVEIFRSNVDSLFSSNLVFTLADHINFAIIREKRNIVINNPLHYDIKHLYEAEYEIGLQALKILQRDLKIRLSRSEASNIALHLINAKSSTPIINTSHIEEVINDIIDIIGHDFNMFIDRNTVNYSRFVSHLQYLLKKNQNNDYTSSENQKLYQSVKKEYPETHSCVVKIKAYLKEEFNMDLNDEESLYLVLHVNRLCVRGLLPKGHHPAQEED